MRPHDLHQVHAVFAAPAGRQYKAILRRVRQTAISTVFSVFAQFVHRVADGSAAMLHMTACCFDGIETVRSSLFRRRCCHGFDSTAGTSILAARRASGRTNHG